MIAYTDHIMQGNNRSDEKHPWGRKLFAWTLNTPSTLSCNWLASHPTLDTGLARACARRQWQASEFVLCNLFKTHTTVWLIHIRLCQVQQSSNNAEPVHDVSWTLTMNSTMPIDRSSVGLPHTWRWPTQNGDKQVIIVLNVQFSLLFGWQWPFQVGHLWSQIKATVLRRSPPTNKKRQIIYYIEVTILSWQALLYYWLPVMTLYISKSRYSIGHWWECTWALADEICKRGKNGQHKLKPCPSNPHGTP